MLVDAASPKRRSDVWDRVWAILPAKWSARKRWADKHYAAAALGSRELKDVGLSHSDRPAIESGLLIQDASRRQR